MSGLHHQKSARSSCHCGVTFLTTNHVRINTCRHRAPTTREEGQGKDKIGSQSETQSMQAEKEIRSARLETPWIDLLKACISHSDTVRQHRAAFPAVPRSGLTAASWCSLLLTTGRQVFTRIILGNLGCTTSTMVRGTKYLGERRSFMRVFLSRKRRLDCGLLNCGRKSVCQVFVGYPDLGPTVITTLNLQVITTVGA